MYDKYDKTVLKQSQEQPNKVASARGGDVKCRIGFSGTDHYGQSPLYVDCRLQHNGSLQEEKKLTNE